MASAEKRYKLLRIGDKCKEVMKIKKCLYEGVIVLAALYGAVAWSMIIAEKRKLMY